MDEIENVEQTFSNLQTIPPSLIPSNIVVILVTYLSLTLSHVLSLSRSEKCNKSIVTTNNTSKYK